MTRLSIFLALLVVALAVCGLLTGCVVRDDFAFTGRRIVAHDIYREGFYDEGGPIVLRFYREGER